MGELVGFGRIGTGIKRIGRMKENTYLGIRRSFETIENSENFQKVPRSPTFQF